MSDTVAVYIASSRFEAEALVVLLETFEIPAEVYQESAGATYGFIGVPLGTVQIRVAEENGDAAREILQAYERGELEAPGKSEPGTD